MRRVALCVLSCVCVCLLGLTLLRARGQEAVPAGAVTLQQDYYGFDISRLKVNHQGPNTLTISVLYRYPADLPAKDEPDVNQIHKDLLHEITTYPNTTDYWEVYESSIANHLFAKYGKEMEALRIKVVIAPTKEEPFARTSLVTRARAGSAPIIP